MTGQQVVISVLADTKNFASGMSDAGKVAGGFGSTMTGLGIAAGAALAAATVAAVGFIATSVKAAAEAEKIATQTEAVLASTGGAAQRSADQIGELANRLSRLSGIDDEVVQSGENVLLTFTRIQGANFDAATQAALDMSVALGKDMTSAATVVGKALNDPIAGIGALSKVGVQLTDDQKALVQGFVDVGDSASAQAIILQELNTQFGGSAEAFGTTFLGSIERVKNGFEGVQEQVGGAFLPVFAQVADKVAKFLENLADSPGFAAFIDNLAGFISGLLDGDSAVGGLLQQLAPLLGFFSPFGLILKAITPVLPVLVDGLSQVASTLGGALAAVLPSITTALTGVVSVLSGALATILPKLIPIIVQLAQVIGSVLASVLPVVAKLLDAVVVVLEALLPVVMPIIDAVLAVVQAFLPLISSLAGLIGPLLEPLIELLVALLVPILDLIAPLLELLVPAIKFVAEVLAFMIGVVIDAIAWFLKLITGSEDAQADVQRVWQSILDFFGGIPDAIGKFFADAGKWLLDAGKNIIDGLLKGLQDAVGAVWNWFGSLGGGIVDFFSDVLGIHSPSTVFRGLGLNIVEGLSLGLGDNTSLIDGAMTGLSSSVVAGLDVDLNADSRRVVSISAPAAREAPGVPYLQLSPYDRGLLEQIRDAAASGGRIDAGQAAAVVAAVHGNEARRRVA